ncbi:zf-HC2 domain-containing protein [Microbacteriaceae bacterium VKM Ac-2855]|nr:zf-HC2 domain-containing protein [Microbacteriaceae bacterium VKM Ac-2855]
MSTDRYRDWDGAYILGSLSGVERREYERHLADCAECRAAVAEFVALPGLLAQVPAEEAQRMLGAEPAPLAESPESAPPSLLSRLSSAAASARRRTRVQVAGLVAAAALVSAAAAVAIPLATAPTTPQPTGYEVALDALPGVPVTASVTFVPEAWGTRIDMDCSYAELSDSASPPPYGETPRWQYVMYVTDAQGEEYPIGSWTSTPGSTMHPSLATGLAIDDIVSVDVRTATTGRIILTGAP